jgi:RNA polymerase sigma factor (sigma-70 family)
MLDPVLRGLKDARDPAQASRELESLIEQRVGPLVRKIVARKLSGQRSHREDVEDVTADAVLVLVKRLQRIYDDPDAGEIERLDDYTATVAYSACAHHLRRRYPERSRLKNRLRYLLGRDPRFALWELPESGLRCGFSRWRGAAADAAAQQCFAGLQSNRDDWPPPWSRSSLDTDDNLPSMLAEIFERSGGPVGLDELTGFVATIWQLDRGARVTGGDRVDRVADTRVGPDELLNQRRIAERLWVEIQALPLRQRIALLLNLRDGQGAGLLWILPTTGVASIRNLAAAMEMPAVDLAQMWSRLPLDDNAIAARLGCSRQQVINLRMSARKRLINRLGNLAELSASRKIET